MVDKEYMYMFTITIDSPVPNHLDIKKDLLNQLQVVQDDFPNMDSLLESLGGIELPKLMGLPDPIFAGYSNIPQELMEVVDAIKYQVDTITMMNVFTPLVAVIGGSLSDFLPKIPVLDVSIIDIVNGQIGSLHTAIVEALKKGIKLPFLPTELFQSYSNYAKEAMVALKMILVGYKEMLLSTMQSMIKSAMSILKVSGVIPPLPVIPTIDQLKQTALEAYPEYNSWYELTTNVDVSDIIGSFGLGAFVIPEIDFIPNYSNYEVYLMDSLNQIKDQFTTMGLSILVDFVESTLGVLGFSFPSITIQIG